MTTATAPKRSTSEGTQYPGVWRAGAIATLTGGIAAAAFAWLLDLVGVPMLAGGPGASTADEVGPANFAVGTMILTAAATILALVLERHAQRPRRTFVVTTVVLTLASLVLPLTAGATATSTKLAFVLGHVVLAAVIIPIIAGALPTSRLEPSAPMS